MKYTAYETYIDFLFSPEAKQRYPYLDFRVDIVSAGDVSTYCPPDGSYVIPAASIHTIAMKHLSPSARIDWQAGLLGENNGQYSETDLTYDEVFNEPASGKIDQCDYIRAYADKAYWDAIVQKYASDAGEDDGPMTEAEWRSKRSARYEEEANAERRAQSEAQMTESEKLMRELAPEYPFCSGYKESEYDQYGIPLTFLNGEEAAVTAVNWRAEGDKLSVSSGALISIDKPDTGEVIPVGYIDFMKTGVCNYYELQFDPTGLLKLK